MAINVLHNIPSVTAQRHLVKTQRNLNTSLGRLASGLRIVRAVKFINFTIGAFDYFFTFDKIRVTQPNFSTRSKPEKFFRWIFHKIVLLNVQFF